MTEIRYAAILPPALYILLLTDWKPYLTTLPQNTAPFLAPWLQQIRITTTTAFLIVTLPIFLAIVYRLTPSKPPPPFPFLSLPSELRNMIYENLLEDPDYPAPKRPFKCSEPVLYRWFPEHFGVLKRPVKKQSNWIFMSNRQVYGEFMDLLTKKSTFHFAVSPPSTPTPVPIPISRSSPPSPSTPSRTSTSGTSTLTSKPLWTISPTTLASLRHCSLNLLTTSSMLAVLDPRTMTPGSWTLAHRIGHELQHVQNVSYLNLHVKAVGDPLWNPLWVWFHAVMSFIPMGETSTAPVQGNGLGNEKIDGKEGKEGKKVTEGPKISKISFSLDSGWSPGENHLSRNMREVWEWRCERGHCVCGDAGRDMTIREFCARIYVECLVCRPGVEGEGGGDEA